MGELLKDGENQLDAVLPYSMHVSSRYLELTKRKLQSTRLPRELELPEDRRWQQGTPKAVLEPLLDYWLEQYDWRKQESHFNSSLPQFRTTIKLPLDTPATTTSSDDNKSGETAASQSLRIHFVHKRSKHENAIPLLFCHNWPSSFIEVSKCIDALTDPHSLADSGAGTQQAFHVVAPSIPGFGFSDASPREDFGMRDTAGYFHGLMERLGYKQYVAHGTGWGFHICRALALAHPQSCLAVHTANPSFEKPALKRSPVAYFKHCIARLTKARIPFLSFGYVPSELKTNSTSSAQEHDAAQDPLNPYTSLGPTLSSLYSHRPQTLSFSLCDSPVGLLAALLDVIHTRAPSTTPLHSRSRSPFLSPVELEMEEARRSRGSLPTDIRTLPTVHEEEPEPPPSPQSIDVDNRTYTWTPTEVLTWTMLQWLPGPEASLRWLRRAHLDTLPSGPSSTAYMSVPLAISTFRNGNTSPLSTTPLMWGSAVWNITWVKRHVRAAHLPAWEAPDVLVLDMRECFGTLLAQGAITLPHANLPVRERVQT
ncbi:alpha/beta-hydrolase [Amniculicola lignicola CBS 123094]|uniref:Alpha/beta-hydrolase n=1 Tax=Amniculicola lignicola CBS 123094 TaxID=1392246 RepID=A0A6A5W524_9PLEO|nr:alpha/beta-hydrolase [Amniculicola lignicola CBS 123094]